MKKLLLLLLIPFTIYSNDLKIEDVKNIKLTDLTIEKPKDSATYNKSTNTFSMTPELVMYYTSIEDAYKLQLELITKLKFQCVSYYGLMTEYKTNITLLNDNITLQESKYNKLEVKYEKMDEKLTFYKTAFGVTLSIDFISVLGVACFMGGFYISNMSK